MVVTIDADKCLGVDKCGKCLESCSMGVFLNLPRDEINLKKLPEKFQIIPFFHEICNGCGTCIDACPEKCIRLDG